MRGNNDETLKNQDDEATEGFQTAEEFLGDADATGYTVDSTLGIKTISPGYCGLNAERAKIANKRVLLGRIGGTMFGVADQVRNPQEVAKGAPPDIGIALVGDFDCDKYADDYAKTGEIEQSFSGGFCYLPGGFQEGELSRFAKLTAEEQAAGHRFAYFIGAEPATNMRGYRYVLMNALRVRIDEQSVRARMRQEAALIALGALGNAPLIEAQPKEKAA